MVRDFFSAEGKSEQVIAQLTGLLASTQSLGRAIASYPWGMISDVIGRKVQNSAYLQWSHYRSILCMVSLVAEFF